jgi:hypothetical protein
MNYKLGVYKGPLEYEMRAVRIVCDEVCISFGRREGATATATFEHGHSIRSYHPDLYAVDIRTRYFKDKVKVLVYETIRTKLKKISQYYDVVLESNHIHIEYDKDRFNRDNKKD